MFVYKAVHQMFIYNGGTSDVYLQGGTSDIYLQGGASAVCLQSEIELKKNTIQFQSNATYIASNMHRQHVSD